MLFREKGGERGGGKGEEIVVYKEDFCLIVFYKFNRKKMVKINLVYWF